MIRNSLIVWLLLCSICHAQQVRLRVLNHSNGNVITGYGGCVMIGLSQRNKNWLFATAAHNVRNVQRVEVMLDNKWQLANVVGTDFKNDVAVIVAFPGKEKLRSFMIGSDAKQGEKVKLHGLYLGKKQRSIWGIARNNRIVKTIDTTVIVGDSGCPYFRKNNELIGIQSAKIPNTQQAVMAPASHLKALLIRELGYIPNQAEKKNYVLYPSTLEVKYACQIILYSGSKCGYCKKWKREELPKLGKKRVDIIEDDPQADQRANITVYPTFIIMKSGKEIARKVGYASAQEIKAMCPAKKIVIEKFPCQRCSSLQNTTCKKCQQQFDQLSKKIHVLAESITSINTQLVTLQNQPDRNQKLTQLQNQLHQANVRIKALEPLLNRQLILESETGKVTAQRNYQPHEAMRIRGVYRSQLKPQ